jgi:predicted dinucleotide-binding enzyme
MNIGILGSGAVAKTLAAGFLKHGHAVTIGTRDAAKLTDWNVQHPAANVGSFAEHLAGAANLKGKVLLDACNPIADAAPEGGVLKFFTTLDDSLMERLQKAFPDTRFVKAFSSVGAARMVNPDFGGTRPTMFLCGNDADAKETAMKILDQFGWESADMGRAESARAIEPLCILWCIPGFLRNEWTHAFKLLT